MVSNYQQELIHNNSNQMFESRPRQLDPKLIGHSR